LASLWRTSCTDRNGLETSNLGQPSPSDHPATRDRLQRITLAHPTIRRLIGCTPLSPDSEIRYCDHRNPIVEPSNGEIMLPNSNDIIIEGEDFGTF
jgi:hypothetical protein